VLLQSVGNLLNMLQVFYPTLVEYEDAIQIHLQKIIGERAQYLIHHRHEICWGIHQDKGPHQQFKKTLFRLEGGLPSISLLYWDLVVDEIKINLTEVFGLVELVKEIIDLGNWVLVPDCDFT
jgi:hypothetical protein